MDLYQLVYFQKVCEYKSFKKAAAAVHVTSPTITIALRKLEEEFGVQLYDRANRDFTLTTAGEMFLALSTEVTDSADRLCARMAEFKDDIQETIRIGVPRGDTYLAKSIYSLSVRYPKINIIIIQSSSNELIYQLSRGVLDCCIVNSTCLTEEMAHRPLSVSEWMLCLPRWSGFEDSEELPLSSLDGYTAFLPQNDTAISDVISATIQKANPSISLQLSSCPVPSAIYSKEGDKTFAVIPPNVSLTPDMISCYANPPLSIEMVLAWNEKKVLSRAYGEFFDAIAKNRAV